MDTLEIILVSILLFVYVCLIVGTILNVILNKKTTSGSINMIVNFAIIGESPVAFNSFEECCAAYYSLYDVKPMPCSSSMELVYCTGYTSQTIYGVSL